MKKSMLMKGMVIGVIMMLIGITTIPAFGLNLVNNNLIMDKSVNNISGDAHPEYYNITIWRLHGRSYEREVKQVSYEEAMEIKEAYEQIESDTDDLTEKAEQKNAVLRRYGVLSQDDTLENYQKEFEEKTDNKNKILALKLLKQFQLKKIPMPQDIRISVAGLFLMTLNGPVHGINIGLPGLYTVDEWPFIRIAWMPIVHFAFGFCPAEGLTTVALFPFLFEWLDPDYRVFFVVFLGMGVITYLPFILKWNREGEFQIGLFTVLGLIQKQPIPNLR